MAKTTEVTVKVYSQDELDRLLETASDRIGLLRDLDLSKEADVVLAEDVSQRVLGVLAVYRHHLSIFPAA